jgi:hypothetical protein
MSPRPIAILDVCAVDLGKPTTELRSGHPRCERHSDTMGEPLAERTGRQFDASGLAIFGMAGRT